MAEAKIKIVADTREAERSLGNLQSALQGIGSAIIGGSIAKQFIDITSEIQEMTNKLISATGSMQGANRAFNELANSAKNTGSNLGSNVDLYQKLAMSTTLAGNSSATYTKLVDQFNKTLKISGASGAAAAAATYQFAQAMQSGRLQGDEFRTLMETNGALVRILAKNITDGSIPALRQMASEGRLTSDIIAKALYNDISLTQQYGKTLRTIPEAFNNLNTSVAQYVANSKVLQSVGQGVVKVLQWLSDNIPALIGGVLGLAAAFATLALRLAAVRAAMISTGIGALIVAAGVAAGYLADKFGLFGDQVKESNKDLQKQNNLQNDTLKTIKERGTRALDLDKTLRQQVGTLKAANDLESKSTGIRSIQLEVEKVIAEWREKYKATGDAIDKQLAKELATETRRKILNEENLVTKRKILELESSLATNNIQDQGVRQVTNQLEQYRLSVTKETYDANKDSLEAKITENIQSQALIGYIDQANAAQAELTTLSIKDKDQREIALAVERERLKYGSLFTSEMQKQIEAGVRSNQQAREAVALEQQKALLAGRALPQSRAEQIQTATGVLGRLDPRLVAEQQYQTEMAALKNTEFENEIQRDQALERLKREHNNRLHQISKQRAEADLRMAGVTNQGILDAVSKSQDNIRMMQEGGLKGAMGAVDQLGYIFGQLGTYNKKAFEAAKAFNIASAVMNTALGVTKVLSMYPPPFNFIAAAAVVASGLAQVAQIRSQTYSGRALGGPVMGGKSYIVGESGPELFTPSTTGSITRNSDLQGGTPVVVNFNITANDTTGFDQLLASRKGMITQIINDAVLEKGRRSIA
jgi:tape measure domain-containing protein